MSDEQRRPLEQLEQALAHHGSAPSCMPDEHGHCVTCSDEARPARVLRVDNDASLALVVIGDETSEADITLVDDVMPGAILLIHGGVALAHLGMSEHIPLAGV